MRHGLTFRALSSLTGLDPAILCRIEHGKRPAKAEEVAMFARILRCKVGDLIPRNRAA